MFGNYHPSRFLRVLLGVHLPSEVGKHVGDRGGRAGLLGFAGVGGEPRAAEGGAIVGDRQGYNSAGPGRSVGR